jgi:predicted DNA binding protein
VVPQADGSALLYGTGSMADRERLAGAADEMHGIADSRLLGADDRRCRFELRISGPSLAAPIADHGGSFERLVFDDGRVDVIATFPADAPISDIVESFVDRYPSTELLARRHREREPAATEQRPLRALTDRQREALDVAYHSGFFEWPRESTGEEIAQRLDITAPTFLEHLRRAERDVVGALLDGE